MLQYKPLPILERLSRLSDEERKEEADKLTTGFLEHPGAQILIYVLRGFESKAMTALQSGEPRPDFYLGILNCVARLRNELTVFLPAELEGAFELQETAVRFEE